MHAASDFPAGLARPAGALWLRAIHGLRQGQRRQTLAYTVGAGEKEALGDRVPRDRRGQQTEQMPVPPEILKWHYAVILSVLSRES
jgi:hypothetical protein